jgi:predicted O-linked N-acetylglucosamine transferase (SPINDLY family)
VKTGHRRDRIKRAADHFIEIGTLNDRDAAQRIHDDRIDILVDLMGYTKGQRLTIFSLRPAPVQVTWIGFAGSAGGRAADYIIADRVVIPEGFDRFYSEKPVRMPVCYQVNDSTRDLAREPLTRAMLGIPEDKFVFCNFNQIAKVTPPVVDLWAQILKRVPNSILWLWDLFPAGSRAMRGHLAERGVRPERVIFGGTLPEPEHLTRYSLCDLFLDSFPYCGHATASNALFGSCPVLTLPGKTFASRVSASLLTALGLTELIAASPQDYVQKAVALARDPARLAALKQSLVEARTTSPLFDGARFAKDAETAFLLMMERYWKGEAPAPIEHSHLPRQGGDRNVTS